MQRVCIIGTGFTASVIYKSLKDKNIAVECIQPNFSDESLISFDVSPGSIFDQQLFERNSKFGGGISQWGHAITFPNDQNFFLPKDNCYWNNTSEKISEIDFEKVFGIALPSMENSETLRNLLPNYESQLNLEKHSYSGGILGNKDPKTFIERIDEYTRGRIISISLNEKNSTYVVELLSARGMYYFAEYETLILAAGTILNACLTSLISGNSIFPIGNHFSRKVAEISFIEPVNLRDIAQIYSKNDRHFLTFTLKEHMLQASGSNSSIRFQIENSRKKAIYYMLRRVTSLIQVRELFEFFISFSRNYLRKKEASVQSAILRIMVDQPLNEINHLEIIKKPEGLFECKITLRMDESTRIRAERLEKEFLGILFKSKYVKSIKICSNQVVIDASKLNDYEIPNWKDAAHYFGSVPMRQQSMSDFVDEEFRLNGFAECYVLGNSTFPVGSHGHPTFLNMCLSYLFGKSVTEHD